MLKPIRPHFLLLFLALSSVPLPAADSDEPGAFEFWPLVTLEHPLSQTTTLYVSEQGKWGDNASELTLHRVAFGAEFDINPHLQLAAHYRHVESRGDSGWVASKAPHADCTLQWGGERWQLKVRNRVEYWLLTGKPNYIRARQRFKLASQRTLPGAHLKPYLAEEWFYSFTNRGWSANRLYAGAVTTGKHHWQIDTYYCLVLKDQGDRWHRYHVLGSSLKLTF